MLLCKMLRWRRLVLSNLDIFIYCCIVGFDALFIDVECFCSSSGSFSPSVNYINIGNFTIAKMSQ